MRYHVVSFMKKMIIFWTGSQIKRINKAENSNPDENTCNSNGNIYGHIKNKVLKWFRSLCWFWADPRTFYQIQWSIPVTSVTRDENVISTCEPLEIQSLAAWLPIMQRQCRLFSVVELSTSGSAATVGNSTHAWWLVRDIPHPTNWSISHFQLQSWVR